MEKKKYKFIYFVIWVIFLLIWAIIVSSLFLKWVDRNSYLELIKWEWTLNNNILEINKREKLSENDVIETKTENSFAVIQWWDWSVTRLWWNTKISVRDLYTSENKNTVKISFDTFSWKTWSNVVSYLWEDSHFKQYYKDTEIAVRWTIFMLDLEKNYLQVDSHKVNVKNDEIWNLEVTEDKQVNLLDFKFISLEDFIRFFRDKEFFDLNRKLDAQYFIDLAVKAEKNLEKFWEYSSKKISEMTENQKQIMYEQYLQLYQDINFVSSKTSEELFNLKISLKEKLIELAPDSEKNFLINTLNYDLKDIFDTKNFQSFETITNILKNNEQFIQSYDNLINVFKEFDSKFEIWRTFSSSLDNFRKNIFESSEYQKFMNNLWNHISKSFNEQKNIFSQSWEFLKNLFN